MLQEQAIVGRKAADEALKLLTSDQHGFGSRSNGDVHALFCGIALSLPSGIKGGVSCDREDPRKRALAGVIGSDRSVKFEKCLLKGFLSIRAVAEAREEVLEDEGVIAPVEEIKAAKVRIAVASKEFIIFCGLIGWQRQCSDSSARNAIKIID